MNSANTPVVGIDVSKKKLDVALLADGKLKFKVVENKAEGYKELVKWLEKQGAKVGDIHVCMESTGVYSEPAALALHDVGFKVSIVNPNLVNKFGQSLAVRNKNDKVDAGVIARYCAMNQPPLWEPPAPEVKALRGWDGHMAALQAMRQQELNRIEANDVNGDEDVAERIRKHVDFIDEEIKDLQKKIDDHIDRHPHLKRDADLLTSIPGIATKTAAKVLARVGDLRRFSSAKKLAAYLGVTPKQRQSGSSVRGRTTMSHMGSREVRTALYFPAVSAMRYNPLLRDFAARLKATGMSTMAVIGAVMRKLVHQMYGVVCSGKPFDSNHLGTLNTA